MQLWACIKDTTSILDHNKVWDTCQVFIGYLMPPILKTNCVVCYLDPLRIYNFFNHFRQDVCHLIKSIFKCIQAKHLINLDMNHSIIFLANFHTPSGNLAFFLYTFHTSSGNLAKNVSRLIQSNVNHFFDQFLKLFLSLFKNDWIQKMKNGMLRHSVATLEGE